MGKLYFFSISRLVLVLQQAGMCRTRTDVLAGGVGGRGGGGRCVAADVAVGEALCGVDDARWPARYRRQTAVDAAKQSKQWVTGSDP